MTLCSGVAFLFSKHIVDFVSDLKTNVVSCCPAGVYNISCDIEGKSKVTKRAKNSFEVYGAMNATGLNPSQVLGNAEEFVPSTVRPSYIALKD